ncbi:unnamed protein product [Cunninghamella echinulata]
MPIPINDISITRNTTPIRPTTSTICFLTNPTTFNPLFEATTTTTTTTTTTLISHHHTSESSTASNNNNNNNNNSQK